MIVVMEVTKLIAVSSFNQRIFFLNIDFSRDFLQHIENQKKRLRVNIIRISKLIQVTKQS